MPQPGAIHAVSVTAQHSPSLAINEIPLQTNLSCLLFPRSVHFHSRTGSFDSLRSSLNSGRKSKQSATAFSYSKAAPETSFPPKSRERLQLLIITLALSRSDFVTAPKLFWPNTRCSQPSKAFRSAVHTAEEPNLQLLDLYAGHSKVVKEINSPHHKAGVLGGRFFTWHR